MLYIGETRRCLRTRFGEHRRAVTSNDANQPVARHFNNGSHYVADMKIRALCPIPGSNDSAKDMKCASFPNLALSTLLALMNVLVTFNAHLSLSDTLPIDSSSFLFLPFCPVSHCLVLFYAIRFTFLCLHFVLMKSIWLAFILSRDVFVLTRIKTRVVFPDPTLLTPDEGPSLERSIFPLSFQVVREPLPFAYHWIHYLHWQR